jgi:hypothetical protein
MTIFINLPYKYVVLHINYLNFPSLPSVLEQEILDIARQAETFCSNDIHVNASSETLDIIGHIDYNLITNLGYHYSTAKQYFPSMSNYHFLEVSETIKKWVAENINPKFSAHVQVINHGTIIPPHVDEVRSQAINYIISSGGDSITSFYYVKEEYKNLIVTPQTSIPYDRLTVTESTLIQPKKWHSLDVTKIHGVTNMDPLQQRIALTLSVI